MEALLVHYGYALLFLGVALEGEAVLLGAALLARRGVFSLWGIVAVAVAANTAADLVYYLLARARGRRWLERRYGGHPRYARSAALMERHGRVLLLVSRFCYGFRILIPAACGALGMSFRVFLAVGLLASVVWAAPTALAGYWLGGALSTLLVDFRQYELAATILLVAVPGLVLAARQARRIFPFRDLRAMDLHTLAPMVIGLAGALSVLSAMLHHTPASLAAVERHLPLEVTQGSRSVMLFAGLALLQVTGNLRRRKSLAWGVATSALAVSLVTHVARGFDALQAVLTLALLAYLVVFRRRFNARSDSASIRFGVYMTPAIACLVLAYATIGLAHLHSHFTWPPGATVLGQAFRAGVLILDPDVDPLTPVAARFLGSIQIAGWLGRLYLLVLLLRPVVLRQRRAAPLTDMERMRRAHARHSLAVFALQDDKHHLVLADRQALVGFAVRGSVALACGDPLAPDDAFGTAVSQFVDHCTAHGWTPCVYEASEERLPEYRRLGLRAFKVAEEAVLDLSEFSLAGGSRAGLRAMANKGRKAGLTVRRYSRREAPDPGLDEQLVEISEEWLADKKLRELGFSLGRFSLEALDAAEVFVCLSGERVLAFCSWLPYRHGDAVVLDLMRKRRDAMSGTMDLLIAESLLALKAAGRRQASLANAPLANVSPSRGALERGVSLLFEHLNAVYGYRNLFQFKKKFAPRWEGRYLVYPRGADLPRVAYALAGLHTSTVP
jgi:phosphatidylglycerol lysyltransferase